MKPKEYRVLEMAVVEGVGYGYNRAFKHVDSPSPEEIKDQIIQAVLNSVCEWFDMEENEGE